MGKIFVVGMGPGNREQMTIQARDVLWQCDVIVGYTVYVELIKKAFPEKTFQQKEFLATPMMKEADRCRLVFEEAGKGKSVALVCSGDAGVYGLSGLILELSEQFPQVDIAMIPGTTAALTGAAVLGAPLIHDFALISLSDLMTPLAKIENRIRHAAQGDFVMVLYNPSSKKRGDYLQKACDWMLEYCSPDTVCGLVENIGREGERYELCTLKECRDKKVNMFTTVFIGNSQTRIINGKMVTPRGYQL